MAIGRKLQSLHIAQDVVTTDDPSVVAVARGDNAQRAPIRGRGVDDSDPAPQLVIGQAVIGFHGVSPIPTWRLSSSPVLRNPRLTTFRGRSRSRSDPPANRSWCDGLPTDTAVRAVCFRKRRQWPPSLLPTSWPTQS